MLFFSPETWGLVLSIYENKVKKQNMKKSDTLLMCWCNSKCGWFEGVHKLNIEIATVFFAQHIEGYIIYITMYHLYIYTYVTISWLGTWFSCLSNCQMGLPGAKMQKKMSTTNKFGPQTRLARTNVTLTVDLRPESSRDRSSAPTNFQGVVRVVPRFGGAKG